MKIRRYNNEKNRYYNNENIDVITTKIGRLNKKIMFPNAINFITK